MHEHPIPIPFAELSPNLRRLTFAKLWNVGNCNYTHSSGPTAKLKSAPKSRSKSKTRRTPNLARPFPRLPPEICDMIIDAVAPTDWRTWAACSLVCRAFHTRSRTHLFRTLVLREHRLWNDAPSPHSCLNVNSVLAFLASAPSVCALVREVVFLPDRASFVRGAYGSGGREKGRECDEDEEDCACVCVDARTVASILDCLPRAHTVILRGVAVTSPPPALPTNIAHRNPDTPPNPSLPSIPVPATAHTYTHPGLWTPTLPHRTLHRLEFGGAVEDLDIAATLRFFSLVPVDTLSLHASPHWPWPDDSDTAPPGSSWPWPWDAHIVEEEPILAPNWRVRIVEIRAQAELAAYYASLLAPSLSHAHIRKLVLCKTADFGGEIMDLLKTVGPGLSELEVDVTDVEVREDIELLSRRLAGCQSLRHLTLVRENPRKGEEHKMAVLATLVTSVPRYLEALQLRVSGQVLLIWAYLNASGEVSNEELASLQELSRLQLTAVEGNGSGQSYVFGSESTREQSTVEVALTELPLYSC